MEYEVHREVSQHCRDKTTPPIQEPEQDSYECVSHHRSRDADAIGCPIGGKLG
ncbi:hypothetical protein TBK1r_35430 [Stieleria magnilauensis]|uniref:Uncharacterized protein n=1 Tax=Stieleria magnilauensis TaxID=2527963 RepID=A0ABX5XRG3_9BACT|nr:hypothetical protein TBK1r_35430 [Planctomycetes bacterium TBK1r]